MKKQRISQAFIVLILLSVVIAIGVTQFQKRASNEIVDIEIIDDDIVPLGDGAIAVTQGEQDIYVMPDKYNTGCKNEEQMDIVNDTCSYGGLYFKMGSGNTVLAVDFVYGNSKAASEIIIKNTDFSAYKVEFRKTDQMATDTSITFENCKFSSVKTGFEDSKIKFTFINCTMNNFVGSNATFESCKFGGTIYDALNPFRNVTLNNCYISDLAKRGTKVLHSDGTQIYGKEGIDAENITYFNCRMEVPSLSISDNASGCYVNACLMVQLEYSNANNLLFERCTLNGGGYSIYAWDKKLGYELNNVVFKDIQIGNAHKFGNIYHTRASSVKFENVVDTDSLYIGSVWKDEMETIHLSVTNDTYLERKLIVVTQKNGEQVSEEFMIPACPCVTDIPVDTPFEELPFDIDIEITGGSSWVVCYEKEIKASNQIRYYNWGNEPVYIEALQPVDEIIDYQGSQEPSNAGTSAEETEIILSGSCGQNVTYELDNGGVLTLSGTGATENYTSSKEAPWYQNKNEVKEVVISEGITQLGNQLFRKCDRIRKVDLPEGLTKIGTNVFISCSSLQQIELPASLESIGTRAFNATGITKVVYHGTEEEFRNIAIGDYNEGISNAQMQYEETTEIATDLASGSCGKEIGWKLSAQGVLSLEGSGATNNYNSGNTAPWFDYNNDITVIEIGEGITVLGEQVFRKCVNVESINIPASVVTIKKNAFIGCSKLTTVTFGNADVKIDSAAFAGTKVVIE